MKKTPSPQVTIACSYSKLVEPRKLNPNPGNPNNHPPEQIADYKRVLVALGFRKSIVVSKQSDQIVTGHGAWLAAIELKLPKVPVDYQDFADADTERAFMLADNRLAEGSEIDMTKVGDLMAQFKADFDLTTTLFNADDLKAAESKLKKLSVQAAPATSWVLIGIPTVKYGEISQAIEKIALRPDSLVETTVTG